MAGIEAIVPGWIIRRLGLGNHVERPYESIVLEPTPGQTARPVFVDKAAEARHSEYGEFLAEERGESADSGTE